MGRGKLRIQKKMPDAHKITLTKKYKRLIEKNFEFLENSDELDVWSNFNFGGKGYYEVRIFEEEGRCIAHTFPAINPKRPYTKRFVRKMRKRFNNLEFDLEALANVEGNFKKEILEKFKKEAIFVVEK